MSDKYRESPVGLTQCQCDRICKKSGLKREETFPHGWKTTLPFLPIEMFDTQGVRKTPLYITKLMEQTGFFETKWTETPDEYCTEYLLRYKLDINQKYYQKDRFNYPLSVDQKIEYVKRTSRVCTKTLRERDYSRPLASTAWLAINVDPETRQLKPYPDHWKQKYSIPSEGPSLDIRSPLKPSSNVLVEQTVVRFTGVDRNNHTNYAVYIRMCLDAFYENILHERYPNGSKVFLNGWLKSMEIVFKKESALGDILTTESWEDAQYKNTYHFEIFNGSDVAAAITFQFYTSLTECSRL